LLFLDYTFSFKQKIELQENFAPLHRKNHRLFLLSIKKGPSRLSKKETKKRDNPFFNHSSSLPLRNAKISAKRLYVNHTINQKKDR